MSNLDQKLKAARENRDAIIAKFKAQLTTKRINFVFTLHDAHIPNRNYGADSDFLDFAYRLVVAEGTVNQAKKELYMHLRENGVEIAHRDI